MSEHYRCVCGSGKYHRNLYDGYGIFLCKVCDDCITKKVYSYRSDIMERYETDDQIDADDDWDGYWE